MGLPSLLLGVLLLATCLIAREARRDGHHTHHRPVHAEEGVQDPYPYAYQPYNDEIAQAKAMAQDCAEPGAIKCPTPNMIDGQETVHWPCVKYEKMCDGKNDCPQGEDEHPSMCMYHKMLDLEMDRIRQVIMNAHRTQ